MTSAIRFIHWSCGVLLLFVVTTAQASHGELQLRNFTPTVKTVNISLQGAQSVMPHLERIYDLISQVLQSSKLHVVRVPTSEDPQISMVIPVVEKLEIHLSMPTPDDVNLQSYVFNLRTQLTGQAEKMRNFTYFPDDSSALYQALQDYFVKLLNLEVAVTPTSNEAQVVTSLDSPENDVTQASGIQYNLPRNYDTHPIISDVLNTQRVMALPVDSLEPIQEQPIAVEPEKVVTEPKQPISPQKEIELRSLTPAVKSVEIRLRGSIREQAVLDDIHAMVSEILQTSRLSVIRVPVVENATSTPAIKLYEHLEIIIQATSPEQAGQPYLIQLSFQEKDSTQNAQQQTFEYIDNNAKQFYEQLRAYMSEHINLSPRYLTQ
ncbi:hypothetical protein [Candidatus Albibeggiatoa sp. nov. NOAA]|uniref:hypothetical protein n=1 Tax=Candidatus Albibeggiatoa sp. nov. NOAA TaxID=3162724 RepID=UPI0033010A43|nr:hypothetical protein [Thiotrichaceae bacterium]